MLDCCPSKVKPCVKCNICILATVVEDHRYIPITDRTVIPCLFVQNKKQKSKQVLDQIFEGRKKMRDETREMKNKNPGIGSGSKIEDQVISTTSSFVGGCLLHLGVPGFRSKKGVLLLHPNVTMCCCRLPNYKTGTTIRACL